MRIADIHAGVMSLANICKEVIRAHKQTQFMQMMTRFQIKTSGKKHRPKKKQTPTITKQIILSSDITFILTARLKTLYTKWRTYAVQIASAIYYVHRKVCILTALSTVIKLVANKSVI